MTIAGSGFWSAQNTPAAYTLQTMRATVCGQPCSINTAATTATSLQCTVPEFVTAGSIEAFQQEAARTMVRGH